MTERPPIAMAALDPLIIKTDAETYQFRSDGDSHGVTSARAWHNEHWNPAAAKPLIVHERLDGNVYVADGHHRLEFAKRLRAKGEGPATVDALVLREADGYTPEDVRVFAAFVNMASGRSGAVEGARVFKEAQSGRVHTGWLPQLQMDKENLKLSYTMSALSDRALDAVEKTKLPDSVAAGVAERFADPTAQETVIRFLAETRPYIVNNAPAYDVRADYPRFAADNGHVARLMRQRASRPQGVTLQ
jgi:hypothetical protein